MQRVVQIPNASSTYNSTNQRIYTRFHRKPQIYPSSFQMNKKSQADNLEEENINNLITNVYKQKKFRGMLDPTSPNNKNIFIDTDSEVIKSDKIPEEFKKVHNKKSTQLLIAKTESQFPETYNSQNVFKRDGITKGYYIKVNPKKDYNTYDYVNNIQNRNNVIRTVFQTPEPEYDENMIYGYNQGAKTQIRPKKEINNYLNYTDNGNIRSKEQLRNQDLKEINSLENNPNNIIYYQNKDFQYGINPIKNKLDRNQQYNKGLIYRKNNISYSKSNGSDLSIDALNNQRKKLQNENNINNFIIEGTGSNIVSPNIEYKNISNENEAQINSEESDHQNELMFYNENDYNNYEPKKIIINDIIENDNFRGKEQGGKVDLYYELLNNKKDSTKRNKNSLMRKDRFEMLENIIENDDYKMNSLIKLQRFIKSYLYLRELCAMKIQAVWRGCNTRKIMDLYNNLDEFIYHLSKVQFNHFNNDFCFFIKQLFNIYKTNISNDNYQDESNEEIENNENDININNNNELIDTEFLQERGYFDPEKLETENEIALVVEGESNNKAKKDYEKLKKEYEDLNKRFNELNGIKNNDIIITNTNKRAGHKKEKNETESTMGSIKSDYKFRFRTNSRDNTNYRGYSEIRHSAGDKEKNSFSNDYDADLDINKEDDFFNQEMSYNDKDNSGSPNDKKYNYYNIHSDENSKYFDNENIKEKESETKKKYINNAGKYTTKRGKAKHIRINKKEKIDINSPLIEKSTNNLDQHSKTFQRKYKYTEDNIIIPKREEEFNIIDNRDIFSSPKDYDKNNNRDIIDITPNSIKNQNDYIKILDDKENEINLLQKKLNEIKNNEKKRRIFGNNLEINKNINEINIKGNKNQNIQLNNIELDKNNKLNERSMSLKAFSKLEPEGISNNRFEVSVNKKSHNNINIQETKKTNLLRNKSQGNSISLRSEVNLKGSKIYQMKENNQIDEIIKNEQFSLINMPKREVRIVTKKILKKTNYIHSRFKDNKTKISSQSKLDIKSKEKILNKNRAFSEVDNKMTKENMIKLKGIGKKFDDKNININNIATINFEGMQIPIQKKKLISSKTCENIINKKSQFKIIEKSKQKEENVINKKTQFKINGIKKDLSDKNIDTCDLIPKEIRITTKKVVKKTNIIKPRINNEITLNNEIILEGLEEPIDKINEKEYNNKKQEWNASLKEEVQQNKFIIKRISKNIYNTIKDVKDQINKAKRNNKENIVDNHIKINIEGLELDENSKLDIEKEKEMNLSSKINNVNKNNIIVRKIKLNINSNQYSTPKNQEQKVFNTKSWNESLKVETLHSKFIIKKQKSIPSKKEIDNNIEIVIGPTEDISKTKNKIMENWNENNEEEKLEELNIEKQPQSKQIKITTKKIIKKTNYVYKRFENSSLNMNHNQLNIEGKQKMLYCNYTSDNSKININFDETKEDNRKMEQNELIESKVNEIYINSNNYKKKEIKITTKTSVTKTKFIHKKFKNNYISHENEIYIKRKKPKINKLEIPLKENEIEKSPKEFTEQGIQKEDNIEKAEKTTDTIDLERKEIKITTKKVIKRTNILKSKFSNNSICENVQIIINKTIKEKDNDIINKTNDFKINKTKKNEENIINKVSQIQLRNNNYNIIEQNIDEKIKVNDTKLHSKKNKINDEDEKFESKIKTPNKNKKLKTVVVYIDDKYDLKNCFNKWNASTVNMELKNNLKNKILKTNLDLNSLESNKKSNETSNFDTINIEDKKKVNIKTNANNNGEKQGKKKRIKIKYVKNSKDNSLNSSKSSENKINNEEMNSSNELNENKTINYRNTNEIEDEIKEMKSLDPKSTRKPFILRINKVEVKKKVLKSNSKNGQKNENVDNKNKIMKLYNLMMVGYFFQKWKQNNANNNLSLKKFEIRFISKSLIMNKRINKFKTLLIKYIFKNK